MSEGLEVRLLGPVEVLRDGVSLVLGSHQQRALLVVLVLEPGRVVSLDRIVDKLWGPQPPPAAVATVHTYVSRLRRVLERDGERVLRTESPGYRFQLDPQRLDATRFEELAARGRAALTTGRTSDADELFASALALWRGPALAGFADEAFGQAAADRLAGLHLMTVEDSIDAALACGRHASVVGEVEALVAEHPLRERLWAQLVLALYRCGRQVEALAALRRVREVLTGEYGVDPGPVLRLLEEQVLRQDPALREQTPPRIAAEPTQPAWSPTLTFVGRDRELATLAGALARADAGHGQVVLVSGEPGVGKTALAMEVAALAGERGTLMLWGQCHDGPGAPALWPWLQVLRAARDEVGLPLDGAAAAPLADLLRAEPGTAATASGAEDRFLLAQALADALARMAAERTLLVVIDDAHWADTASQEILQTAGARATGCRMLLVVTHRDTSGYSPLDATLAALARLPTTSRLELRGLDERAVARIVAAGTGSTPPGEFVRRLHERTDGNPFFLSEVLRSATPDAAGHVPAGVRDVLRRRLLDLPPDTFGHLALAATLGRDFDVPMLAAAAGLTRLRCAELLDPAVASRIVVAAGNGLWNFRFAHALVRETLLADLSPLRTARMHAQAAAGLRTIHGDEADIAEPIAHHLLAAAALVDVDAAVPQVVRAAEVASARAAYEASDRLLVGAAELVAGQPSSADRNRAEADVLLRLVRLRLLTRGYLAPGVQDLVARARRVCATTGAWDELAEALAAAAVTAVVGADTVAAVEYVRQGLEVAEQSGGPWVRYVAEHTAGMVALYEGRVRDARTHLRACLTAHGALGAGPDDPRQSNTPYYSGLAYAALVEWLSGDGDAARDSTAAMLLAADRKGDPLAHQVATFFAALIAGYDGDFAECLRWAAESVAAPPDQQAPLYTAMTRILVSWARSQCGDGDGAVAETDAALDALADVGAGGVWASFLGMRAETLLRSGDRAGALAAIDDALAAADTGEKFFLANLLRIRGDILRSDPATRDLARGAFEEAAAVGAQQGAVVFERRAAIALAALGADAGH